MLRTESYIQGIKPGSTLVTATSSADTTPPGHGSETPASFECMEPRLHLSLTLVAITSSLHQYHVLQHKTHEVCIAAASMDIKTSAVNHNV